MTGIDLLIYLYQNIYLLFKLCVKPEQLVKALTSAPHNVLTLTFKVQLFNVDEVRNTSS